MSPTIVAKIAVEGIVDEVVVRRLFDDVNLSVGDVHGRNGKSKLRQGIAGYNHAARFAPWVVLVDLDQDADCAPPLRLTWLPMPSPYMCFRIAVRAVEAWLMADSQHLASFLGVARSRIPTHPETLSDPKAALVHLARHSRCREIREDMIPRPRSGRRTGPAYASRLIEFASSSPNPWRPEIAARHSESLRRAINALHRLAGTRPDADQAS